MLPGAALQAMQEARADVFAGEEQQLPDQGVFAVRTIKASIADIYHAFDGRTEDLPAQSVPVICVVSPSGKVILRDCYGPDGIREEQQIALNLAHDWGEGVDFPRFEDLSALDTPPFRSLNLTLEIPAISAPQVDLATGPLVEKELLDFTLEERNMMAAYPSRAIREEIEGVLQLECQVQADLSVICTNLFFDPGEYAAMFDRAGTRLFRGTRVKPQLKDGRDARGVRWRPRVVFNLYN
jgi:hypothetical protein